MSVQLFDNIIKEGDSQKFQELFKHTVFNEHHRHLLLEKCFISGNADMIEFMLGKNNISSQQLGNLLLKSLEQPIKESNLKFFTHLTDQDLPVNIEKINFERLVVKQEKSIFDWFIYKFPLASFRNFKAIAYTSMRCHKEEYIKPFYGFQFDKSTCFNFCLCAFENDKRGIVNDFLKSQIKFNNKLVSELKAHQKDLFTEYKKKQAIIKARLAAFLPPSNTAVTKTHITQEERFNTFMQEELAKSFNDYLEEKIVKKTDHKTRTKHKI